MEHFLPNIDFESNAPPFSNESPFPSNMSSMPFSNEIVPGADYHPSVENKSSPNEPTNIEMPNANNNINMDLPFIPSIEPWMDHQFGINYDDNSSVLNDFNYSSNHYIMLSHAENAQNTLIVADICT